MKIVLASLLTIIFFACNPSLPDKKADQTFTFSTIDSLHPASFLSCTISYYLVGRIKKAKIETGIPFTVNVLNLDSALYNQEIAFRVIDDTKFEIFYTKDDTRIKSIGIFNSECRQKDIGLTVFKTDDFRKIYKMGLTSTNYMFIISKK